MIKVLFIIGSIRKWSFNKELAKAAAALLQGKAEVRYIDYSQIPYMNQDIEFPAPEIVARIREEVFWSDGIWIFSPEYNHSYPGVLKNLLDWLSRPVVYNGSRYDSPLVSKPVTISTVTRRGRGAGCRTKLVNLLETLKMDVMGVPTTSVHISQEAFSIDQLSLSKNDFLYLTIQAKAFIHKLTYLKR